MTTNDPRSVAATYFRAWKERDFTTLRGILADDVTFEGPLAVLDNADDCVKGLQGMAEILDDIAVQHVFVDGPDVLTWYAGSVAGTRALPSTRTWISTSGSKRTATASASTRR